MKPTLVSISLLVCMGVSTSLLAQEEHPNRATGAREETTYASYGSDDVNLFNGNLTYRIPVGTPVPVGPKLAIAPTLVYNSNHEQRWLVCKDKLEYVTGDRAVGAGWRLHFGRLIPVSKSVPHGSTDCNPPSASLATSSTQPVDTMISTGWGFEEPDGAVHEFYDRLTEASCDIDDCENPHPPNCFDPAQRTAGQHCFAYSHDGSYLRLDPIDPEHANKPTIYFPNGTFLVLGFSGGRYPIVGTSLPTDLDFAFKTRPYNATLAGDLYGNQYTVQYYGDGTAGSPPHPLAAAGVPDNQRDALPYRVFPSSSSNPYSPLFPSVVFSFEYETLSYVSDPKFPAVAAPRLVRLVAPSGSSDGSGGWREAAWTFTQEYSPLAGSPRLTRLQLPTLPAQEQLDYQLAYETGLLSSVRLPTRGSIEYDYGEITLWAQQASYHVLDPLTPEYKYAKDFVTGVTERRTYRRVQPADGSAAYTEEARTSYDRSYRVEDACSESSREDCRLRVDVWSPRGSTTEAFRVTRTIYGESNMATNAALYGRALEARDYALYVPGLNRLAVDGASPYRTTIFSYQFDGPASPSNPNESAAAGTNHNTRESGRVTTWGSHSMRTAWESWDGYGHWRTTVDFEDQGTGEVEVRRVAKTHLNRVSTSATGARWILDPETSRTISRPADSSQDPADANLSTWTEYFYDSAGFMTEERIASSDLGKTRLLRRVWTKGVSPSAPCRYLGASSEACSNLGFPTLLTETMKNALDGVALNSKYERYFFYRYGTLAAAYDGGTNFYVVDRDVAPNGAIVGERGSAGRNSLTDDALQLTTTTALDLLDRPITVRPPDEGNEELSREAQRLVRVKRDSTGTESNRHETYFDQLGRPSAERVKLPGGEWSCRITTYDAAGRRVGQSEWWKDGEASLGALCQSLIDSQAVIGPGGTPSSVPPGTTWSNFDVLGRPQATRSADGSMVFDEFAGWWWQSSVRTVNAAPPEGITVTTELGRDRYGRVSYLKEPPATKADSTAMNPAETTTYRYDHEGRLISIRKPGSDSNAGASVTQVRTRSYDDFGWLVSQVDPEEPLRRVTARDARGNAVRALQGSWQILRTFDAGGRLINTERSNEGSTYDWGGTPVSWYEVFAYDTLPGFDFGRSNGKLVWSIRANHVTPNHAIVDYGWFGVTSFYHYNGLGGRLGFRQQSDFLMPEPALPAPQLLATAERAKKSDVALALERYFTLQGRAAKSEKDLKLGLSSAVSARSALTGSAAFPSGPARWSYTWDSTGRLSSVTYPRRDEGFATQASYGYESGFMTSVSASFSDPFAVGSPGSVTASLAYDAAGRVRDTSVSTSEGGSEVLRVSAVRDPSGLGRPSKWSVYLPRVSASPFEEREYAYDPSGNVIGISSSRGLSTTYLYDARNRLIRDNLSGRGYNPQSNEYDGFGNLVTIREGGIATSLSTSRATNRLVSSLATYDDAGRMIEDVGRRIGRDYYPDGALLNEYAHLAGSNNTLSPTGISMWLVDGQAENVLSYWANPGTCEATQFRSFVRDEGGKILTEYRAEAEAPCTCTTPCVWRDRFYRDVVRLGPWAKASYTRGVGVRLEALDHLGSPRYVTSATGQTAETILLDSFGRAISGTPATRETFTGHERNHVSGDGPDLPISDYMHARTYVPMFGRFTRPDPADNYSVLDPQGLNRYSYARNSPVRMIDPDGRVFVLADERDRAFFVKALTPGTMNSLGRALFLGAAQASERITLRVGRLPGDSTRAGFGQYKLSPGTQGFIMLPSGELTTKGPATITVDASKYRQDRLPSPTQTIYHELLHDLVSRELGIGFNSSVGDTNRYDRNGRPVSLGLFDTIGLFVASMPDAFMEGLRSDEVSALLLPPAEDMRDMSSLPAIGTDSRSLPHEK